MGWIWKGFYIPHLDSHLLFKASSLYPSNGRKYSIPIREIIFKKIMYIINILPYMSTIKINVM